MARNHLEERLSAIRRMKALLNKQIKELEKEELKILKDLEVEI